MQNVQYFRREGLERGRHNVRREGGRIPQDRFDVLVMTNNPTVEVRVVEDRLLGLGTRKEWVGVVEIGRQEGVERLPKASVGTSVGCSQRFRIRLVISGHGYSSLSCAPVSRLSIFSEEHDDAVD